jgi:hypothetical protein
MSEGWGWVRVLDEALRPWSHWLLRVVFLSVLLIWHISRARKGIIYTIAKRGCLA